MFSKDTFLTALESGLSGGASGALGGAVGRNLAKFNDGDASLLGQAERAAAEVDAERALKNRQRREELAREPGEVRVEETAVNDDPAVHTAEQNASIEQYKNSVDPKMAEYVDKVRAGEKLEPYVVTKTSDRMRSAMMELTGLEKVGDYTLLDNNGVQHITNRHAGGDGSADATMKNSADVARAAYVLNNFDNAYLGTRKAEGYFDSRSKRAPIVIFEKKIDGSHIIVEAVTDTKRGKNYIISEYLSSVGVDPKEIAKTLRPPMDAAESDPRHTSETLNEEISTISASMPQSPMDAVADPRDTSKTLAEDYDATASIAPARANVNGNGVENGVETVKSAAETAADGMPSQSAQSAASSPEGRANASAGAADAESYADVENRVDAAQLDTADWNRGEQRAAARQLVNRAQMTTKAAQAVVDAMPQGVGATVYSQAVNSLYRMGVTQDVQSFEQAVNLTGGMNSLGGAVRQVLALGDVGENALRIAYTYGKGEAEAYNARKAAEIGSGKGAVNPDAGTYFKGRSVSKGGNALDAFIELGAKSSGTAIHRAVEGLKNGAKGYIRAAAGEMYLSGEAGSETVMHETFHALNEWSPETGQAVMDRLLTYLVQQNGMESTEKLVESYLARYEAAGQRVTWNQALEEITADAMETVFGTEEAFRDFVRQQAAEARMNASARGMIGKVMDHIKNLLDTVLADVNRFLKKEPTNAAAKAARSLTETQLKDLQALYFEHQAEAGAKYREAVETAGSGTETKNAAPSETEDAAVKYSIDEGFEQAIDRLDIKSHYEYPIRVGATSEVLKSIGVKDREIVWKAKKIREILNKHSAENVRAGKDKSIMTKAILKQVPQVLENPILVVHSDTTQNKEYASRIFMYGDVKDATVKPVNVSLELLPTDKKGLAVENIVLLSAYGHSEYTPGRVLQGEILYVDPDTKRTSRWLRDNRLQLPFSLANAGSKAILHYAENGVKAVDAVPLPGQQLYYLKAVTKAEAERLYPDIQPGSRNAKLAEFLTQDGNGKYQLDVDSEAVEAAKTQGLGDVDRQTELVGQVVELGGKVRLSDQSIAGIVRAVLSDTNSRMSAKTLTERLRALSDYLALTKNVSWEDANAFMTDIAEQIMLKSSKKNDELWRQYPELHQMSMTIEKGSADYKEILYHWGSWADARKELARHGVKITQSKEGVHSRWDADFTELQKLGAGLLPTETPNSAVEALEAMAAAHDNIRPVMENAYGENWDGAKQDIAMQLWQRYMNSPEVANEQNAEARKEFAQQWEEVRKQAKQEALEARAKAVMKLTEKRLNDAAWAGRELAKRSEAERARRDAQIDKVRTAREMDNTRRAIRRLTTQLNGIITKDKAGSGVPASIASQVLEVAKLANENLHNKKMLDEIGKLSRMIHTSAEAGERDRVGMEWLNSGLEDAITDWMTDVNDSRELALARTEKEIERVNKRLEQLIAAAEKTGQDYSKDIADLNAYASHLEQRRAEYAAGGMARMTSGQLRGLRSILEETIHIVKNENKLLGEEYQETIDTFADGMTKELREAKGTNFGNSFAGKVGRKLASYKLNTMNIERTFERMGGYVHGGYMEKAGKMLNDGQNKKTRLIVEGTAFFDNVTGPGSLKKMDRFSHELIDIGLRDAEGKAVKITREQAVALYFQCQNLQGLHHMTHGGLKVMNMEYAVKGDTEMAKHYAETVRIGDLKFDDAGHMLDRTGANVADEAEQMRQLDGQRREFLAELEKALFTGDMADYCKLWIEDYKAFEQWTKKNINETSMILNGRAKATVENYIPLHVDEDTNVKKNEGIRYDNSVGSEGFLKQRVPSGKPIWLDGIGSVVNTSLENVAQYAGMAIPLRNIQKLMNTQLDGKTLYAAVNQTWGAKGEQYLTQAITDLHPQRGTANLGDSSLVKLRSRAAAAVLTANLNVTFLQAASLPTAAAELGWKSTGAAGVQFLRNLNGTRSINAVNQLLGAVGLTEKSLKNIEQEISEHGDVLLQYRLRGTKSGELGSLGEMRSLLGKAHDALLDADNKLIRGGTQFADDLAGSITKMDEITVAALWEGAKSYVKNNPTEFAAEAADIGSAAYWEAVNQQYQRVVERTQPNYTTMQRTGFQRTGNDTMKTLMMFSTQRQQNAQIWVSAAEDYMAQKRRADAAEADLAKATADNDEHWMKACAEAVEKAQQEKSTAGKRLIWAITSQAVQTTVIAAIGMGVKLLLHRRKDLQDENGDITIKSAGGAFGKAFLESLVGNFVGGSELYTAVAVILGGTDYDTVSLTGFSTVNDTVAAISSLVKEIMKDTSELDEEDRAKHDARVQKDILDLAGSISQFYGIPFNNVKKYFEAAAAYAKDVRNGTLLDFSDLPESATGQYDRLYNAIAEGDTDNASGAMAKLEAMGKDEKTIASQLKNRLKKYDEDLLKAAEEQNAGKSSAAFDAKIEVFERLRTAYGVKAAGERGATAEDAARRSEFIDLINKAVNEKAEELYKGGTGGSVYDALTEAVDSGRADDVQDEVKRLRTAGKDDGQIRSKITDAVKEEYLAGNDHDRERLEQMLLKLTKADGSALYEEKNFAQWVRDAEKKEESAKNEKDEWAGVR